MNFSDYISNNRQIFLCIIFLTFTRSCEDGLNSIEVINDSNHTFVFAFGEEHPLEFEDLTIKVDSGKSFIYYGIDPGSIWIYYASIEIGEVYTHYLGGITGKDNLIFTIDTIFDPPKPLEECGTCLLVTENGNEITYGTPLLYCGDAYQDRLHSTPTTVGNVTTYWDCY